MSCKDIRRYLFLFLLPTSAYWHLYRCGAREVCTLVYPPILCPLIKAVIIRNVHQGFTYLYLEELWYLLVT